MKSKNIIIVCICFFVLFLIFLKLDNYIYIKHSKEDIKYLEKVSMNLSGKVIDVYDLAYGHGCAIVTIEINESNYKNFNDLERDRFIGIIKNGKGYLTVINSSFVEKGDFVIINSKVFKVFRKDKLIDNYKMSFHSNFTLSPYIEYRKKLESY
jgi:hypothetical protein